MVSLSKPLILFIETNFEKLFAAAGLQICHTFGDYNLQEFDINNSERLILIAKKL